MTCKVQNHFAAQSQQKCEAAQTSGAFKEEKVPVTITSRKGIGWVQWRWVGGDGRGGMLGKAAGSTAIEVLLPNHNRNVKLCRRVGRSKEEIVLVTITSRKGMGTMDGWGVALG